MARFALMACPSPGFHSIPSMQRLHLHVISQDFDAVPLKTKKHWNSFTTPFFLSPEHVRAEIVARGEVRVDDARAKAMLKQPLRCEACDLTLANIPGLKSHLRAKHLPVPKAVPG